MTLLSPSTVPTCSADMLEPTSDSALTCTVSVPASKADFENGTMDLQLDASAIPRGVGVPANVTAQARATFSLTKVYRVSVAAAALPTTVDEAGGFEPGGLNLCLQKPFCISHSCSCQYAVTPVRTCVQRKPLSCAR